MGQQETTSGKLVRGGRRSTGPEPGTRSETVREGAVRKKGKEGPPDDAGPGLGATVADLVRQVSWSVFVCVGLAIGTAVSKLRVPLTGVLGLLAAPTAFAVARSLHQSAAEALAVSGTVSTSDVSVVLIALLKGLEYGCLGLVVGWVGQRVWGGVFAHVAAGLAVGVVFGGAIVSLTYAAAPEPLPAAKVVSQGVNEVLFPVGCALVLFVAAAVARWQASQAE